MKKTNHSSLFVQIIQKAIIAVIVLSFVLSPFGVTDAYAIDVPNLVAPTDGITTTPESDPPLGIPVFEWEDVETAKNYRFQLSNNIGFSSLVVNVATENTRYVPVITSLTDGMWYWRVRVESPSVSEWSSIWAFTKDWSSDNNYPALLAPADGAMVDFYNNPTFTWEHAVGAAQYKFEIANSSDFGTIKYTGTTANTSHQPKDKLPSGILYFWRVTPISVGNQIGTISEVRSFTSVYNHIPQLLEPADGSFPTFTPSFKWEAVIGAQRYRLQYSTTEDFSANLTTIDTENTSWTPTSALPNDQNYYWHVQVISGASLSDWSETRSFRKQWYIKPMLLTPTDGFQRARFPFFSWTPVPGASYYRIEIDDDPGFGSLYETGTTSNPFYVPNKYQSQLPGGELFYWRVTPYDSQNNRGVASNSASYRSTATNNAPELIYPFYYYPPVANINPQEDRTASIPLMLWHRLYSFPTGEIWAKAYQVRIATDPNFNNVVWQVLTENLGAAPTMANPFEPVAGQDYYWQVIPTDEYGNPLDHTSQTWRARFDPSLWIDSEHATSPSEAPQPIRPRNGLELVEMTPVLEWKPVEGATSYEVQISRNTAFTQIVLADEVPYPAYAPVQAIVQRNLGTYDYGTFYWRVRALDDGTPMEGGWNASYRFQIASQATWRLSRVLGDPANQLEVASDATGDVAPDYDLTRMNICQDKDYWYIGFPVPTLTTNTDYLVLIDLDHVDGSGAPSDPLGIGISTITSHLPEYIVHVDQIDQEYIPQNVFIYAWNPDTLTYNPYQPLAEVGGDLFEDTISGYLELRLPNTPIGMNETTGSMSVAVISLDGSSNTPQDTVPSNTDPDNLIYLTSASERMNLRTPPDTAIYTATPSDPRSNPSILPYFYDYPVESLWAGNYIETHLDPQFTSKVNEATYTGVPAYYSISQETWGIDLADNTYFWRVRPRYYASGTYYSGVWSQGNSYKRVGFIPTNLQTSVTYTTPTFSWDRVEGAQTYRLVIANNPSFTSPVVNITTAENQYTPNITLQHNTTYYWKVSIIRYGGIVNEGYAWQQFTLQLPQPTGLRHEPDILLPNFHPYPPTLCWDALIVPDEEEHNVLAAWKYRVEISIVDTFATLFDNIETEQQCWTSNKNFADGTYFWRVAMIDGESKRGPWSDTNQFTKQYPAPSLISPANGSLQAETPLFVWTPVDGAANYVLEVAYDQLFVNKVFGTVTTPNVNFIPIVKLTPERQYYWRVAIKDNAGNLGPFTDAEIRVGTDTEFIFIPVTYK